MSVRASCLAAAFLCTTGCGATNGSSGASGFDASDEWLLASDATLPDDTGLEAGGNDAPDRAASYFDAGLDVAASAVWPLVDSACSPPPFDGGAESSATLGDAGLATVTTLPDGGYIGDLVVDDTTVYWTDYGNNTVLSVPLAGGPPGVVADVGTPEPTSIAVDDRYVFWVSRLGQRILRCPKGTANCTPFVVLAPFQVGRIALDAYNVYAIVGDTVVACAKTGCRDAPTVIASGLGTPYDIAVQGDTLYLLDYPPNPSAGVQINADVVKCPVSGCGSAPTVLASDADPSGMATDGRYVYWTSQIQADQPASVKRCAVCGCGGTPDVLLPASAGLVTYSVLTDGAHVFFVGNDPTFTLPGRLLACSVDGCGSAPTELLSGVPHYATLALGGARLVFATDTQILSIAE